METSKNYKVFVISELFITKSHLPTGRIKPASMG